ncbi:MAG: hypothetical protein AMXMBFR58_03580 [Phycisphaerae bacterium]|nr:hypothetical protein [Phycisphaerales bacterium]MCK6476887.1 DUF2959 domain-containing protein [Phycisphaerales bacterium]
MTTARLTVALVLAASLCPATLSGCASTGIAVREAFGYAKREQLVDRVGDARDEQVEAKKQFESALAEFLAVTGVGGSPSTKELEDRYAKLKDSYEDSETQAQQVRDRIADVENVAEALFKEWNAELGQYSDQSIRAVSEKQLKDTRDQYEKLLGAMKAASAKMDPVLAKFKDQVLFLKHNLNARAISSLQGTATQVESDVSALIAEMQAAIDEADAFIKQMQSS